MFVDKLAGQLRCDSALSRVPHGTDTMPSPCSCNIGRLDYAWEHTIHIYCVIHMGFKAAIYTVLDRAT